MNRVQITTRGPVMEDLAEITVVDDYDNEVFHVDNADLEQATKEGPRSVIDLVAENASTGYDILKAAVTNGSPVYLDGADVAMEDVRAAMETRGSPSP